MVFLVCYLNFTKIHKGFTQIIAFDLRLDYLFYIFTEYLLLDIYKDV